MSIAEVPVVEAAPRPPLLAQAVASLLLGAALLGLATVGHWALLGGVIVVQLVVTVGFLSLVEVPAPAGVLLLAAASAAAADVIVIVQDGDIGGLVGVVALAMIGALFHQLSRKHRSRVTESLADTLVVVIIISAAACLPAALQLDEWPVRVALAAAGAALVAGRLADLALRRPALAAGATRAWPGLLLALGAGVAAAVALAGDHLTNGEAALIGLAAAATVAAVDLSVDLAARELTTAHRDARRVAALRPVALFLPFALLGPVAFAAVELLERSA